MSEILFGQPYYLRFDPKLYAAMQPYPPLGTLYAASYLRERGHSVALFDAMLAHSEHEWVRALEIHAPRFAVLFEDSFNYLSKMCLLRMRQAALVMIRAAKAHDCTVIVSGSDATDHLAKYFANGADFIIIGEGEITLAELLDALKHSERQSCDWHAITGLAWANPDGSITRTAPRDFIRNLDILPFPAWDLADIASYRKIWRERHGYFSMNLVTTRGCPYHCNWCAKPIYGQRYSVRSPENVVAEMKLLQSRYAPDHIEFADDIFGLKPGWLERFAALVVQENVRIPFKCLLRADLVNDRIVVALKRAGCETVWMGAESGSQKILDAMEKGQSVEQIYAAAERLHRAAIRVGFFLQFGYSGEDRSDIENTLQMVRDCKPDDIGISVSYPLPGTKFYARVEESLGEKKNWFDSNDLAMMYHGTYAPEFYRTLYHVVHHEFRMRRAIDTLVRARRLRARNRLGLARLVASVPYHFFRWQLTRHQLAALTNDERPRTKDLHSLSFFFRH